jgi:hypothetical protein
VCTRRRTVDADVRERLEQTNWNQGLDTPWAAVLRIYRIDMGQSDTAHGDRHRVQAGVAGLEVRRPIALLVMRGRMIVLVRGGPVVMLRMIVIGVQVRVQRRELAGGRGQRESEQDCRYAMHKRECMRRERARQTPALRHPLIRPWTTVSGAESSPHHARQTRPLHSGQRVADSRCFAAIGRSILRRK